MNKDQMIQRLLAEFVGTAIIMLGYQYFQSLPIFLAIYVIAKTVTLADMNPLVTLWYYLGGKTNLATALSYVVAQVLAVVIIAKTDF
jgi:hypothetical protein